MCPPSKYIYDPQSLDADKLLHVDDNKSMSRSIIHEAQTYVVFTVHNLSYFIINYSSAIFRVFLIWFLNIFFVCIIKPF